MSDPREVPTIVAVQLPETSRAAWIGRLRRPTILVVASQESLMGRLQDFDIRLRAIATLVDDWQLQAATVRTIWTLEDLLRLAVQVADSAHELDRELQHRSAEQGEQDCNQASDALEYFVAGLRKLGSSVKTIDGWVGMFESQGYMMQNTLGFRRSCSTLADLTAKYEVALEAAWNELDRQAPSSDEILEIASALRPLSQTFT